MNKRTFEIMPRNPDAKGLEFQSSIYELMRHGHNLICEVYITEEAENIKRALNAYPDLLSMCSDLHALLWHYDLARQPNGVDWGEPDALRREWIDKLEALFKHIEQKE